MKLNIPLMNQRDFSCFWPITLRKKGALVKKDDG
jgi:hypothetical protein